MQDAYQVSSQFFCYMGLLHECVTEILLPVLFVLSTLNCYQIKI